MSNGKNKWGASPQPKNIIKDEATGEHFSVGWDADHDPEDYSQWTTTFYYKPTHAEEGEHFHISLSQEQVKSLNKWLTKFLIKISNE